MQSQEVPDLVLSHWPFYDAGDMGQDYPYTPLTLEELSSFPSHQALFC